MNIKSFAIGSVVGVAVGIYGFGKVLDSLTEHKHFIWGFRNFKETLLTINSYLIWKTSKAALKSHTIKGKMMKSNFLQLL